MVLYIKERECNDMDCILCYCDKCGSLTFGFTDDSPEERICFMCNGNMKPVPREYINETEEIKEELEEEFIERYVKSSPNFDQYYFDHKDEIANYHNQQYQRSKAFMEEKNRGPKCPSCGSSNISKIGVVSRAVSVGIFGLASSKIGKTHKCNNCGTTW